MENIEHTVNKIKPSANGGGMGNQAIPGNT